MRRPTVVDRVVAHLLDLEQTLAEWDRTASLRKLERVNREEGWGWDEPVPSRPESWLRVEGVRLTPSEKAEVRRRLEAAQ